ncbi:MFS transporter [Paenibacillus sp. BSR1-1]|uniref:MFS transporter n=1 Tax=Paenibacillus sp. BSR1-1 TaxID=3020845 RepID=UPI0025AF75C0|nr:MFS transporter [Paenibacillus sp. BSR1-1]MDN3020096.1 MFS transporter [Paenibacillus sp. BSR1-1]
MGIMAQNPSLVGNSLYTEAEKRNIILAACLGWGLEFFDLQLLALYGPQIMAYFGIDKANFGMLVTVQLIGTALGGLLFGWLADKYGRKRVLTWTILVFSISTALVAVFPFLTAIFILRFITGLGTGGEWAIGFSLLNEVWTPKRRGLMGGIVQASIWPAYAIAIFVSSVVVDWRVGFLLGVLPALAALWVRIKCPESKAWLEYNELKKSGNLPKEIKEQSKRSPMTQLFLKDMIKHTILGTIIVFGGQYAYYVFSSWMPTLFTETFQLSPAAKANILYAGSAVSFISYILAGWASDKWGRKKAFRIFAYTGLIAYGLFALLNYLGMPLGPIVVVYMAISFGIGFFGIFGIWFGELFPTRVRASGSSFCYSVGRGIASIAPAIAGFLSVKYGLGGGISTGFIAIIVLLIASIWMNDRKGREIGAIE